MLLEVILAHNIILIVRSMNRGVAIDAYDINGVSEWQSSQLDQRPDVVSPTTVHIAQAQTVAVSRERQVRPATNEPGTPLSALVFHVLAALPYSLDHYLLTLRLSSGSRPEMDLTLMGNDHGCRKQPGARSPPSPVSSDDGYDSDSTLNRIAQPSQVLDLQVGPSSFRAVAIQIAAHTNDRTIWAYTVGEDGGLSAKRLSLTLSSKGGLSDWDAAAEVDVRQLVKGHACRAVFDEVTGKVVIALDCQQILVLDY